MATYSLVIRRLMICSLTIVVSRAITNPLLTLFLNKRLGLNQQDVGLLRGIAVFIATLLGLYGGYVIDRLEKRKLLILAMHSSSVGFVLLTLANNVYLTTLTLVVTEAASAPFLIASAIAFCSVFLMIGIAPTQRSDDVKPLSFLNTLTTLKSDRTLIIFTCGSLLSTIVHGRYTLYISQYLLVMYKPDQALNIISAVLACNAVTVILMQYQIGRFLNREQLRYWICLGTAFFIAGLTGFSHAQSMLSWCVAMFVFTLGEMIIYPAEFLFIDTIAPEPLRGSYYGAQNLAAFGGAMSPVICGYLLINSTPGSMFYVLSCLTAVGGTLCFLSGRRIKAVL
ncbi:MAG: MFS transporter [Pseudomonas sp.]